MPRTLLHLGNESDECEAPSSVEDEDRWDEK